MHYYKVCPDTLVKLAIDLVHSIYNTKMEKITEKICEHRKDVEEKKGFNCQMVDRYAKEEEFTCQPMIVLHDFGLMFNLTL